MVNFKLEKRLQKKNRKRNKIVQLVFKVSISITNKILQLSPTKYEREIVVYFLTRELKSSSIIYYFYTSMTEFSVSSVIRHH